MRQGCSGFEVARDLRNNQVPVNLRSQTGAASIRLARRGAPNCSAGASKAQPLMSSLKAFIVEDSPVIRENLIAALEELAPVQVVGTAEDEAGAMNWLGRS